MDPIYRFLWFPRHYKLITEALSFVIDRLRRHEIPESDTSIEKLNEYERLQGMLTAHMPAKGAKPCHEQLNAGQLRQIKTALLLYAPILEAKRGKIITDAPDAATEGIDQQIELAKKLINEKAFAPLEPDAFPDN
jgi:hypothetical protein